MFEIDINSGLGLRVQQVADSVWRISRKLHDDYAVSGLNRYQFLAEDLGTELTSTEEGDNCQVQLDEHTLLVNKYSGLIELKNKDNDIILKQLSAQTDKKNANTWFAAQPNEDWVGFGDQNRTRLLQRGHTADLWVRNVKSYQPVPFFMSTLGYGVVVNTTHRILFDMCAKDTDKFGWHDNSNELDFYLLTGNSFKEMLGAYHDLSGAPRLPPKFSFGLWFVARMQANDHEVLSDVMNFRREGIPLDIVGLEPGWMEKDYDYTTEKTWSEDRFPIPFWQPNGPYNFANALERTGVKLGLWLCNQYDLTYEEERRIGNNPQNMDEDCLFHADAEVDLKMMTAERLDKVTKIEEPWFDHLKKFVDQGASYFKLDGSLQVNGFPDRLYGNGMIDAEVHNMYPLMYSRQLHEGFQKHTNRRALGFTCAGWTGFQAYGGTWVGDTGGKVDTLGGLLNNSLTGHSWVTVDMEVVEPEGIHMGYFLPWSQICTWHYFRQPWLQGKKVLAMHQLYSQLRMRLMPYIYSYAYEATVGLPIMRPLVLEYQDDMEGRKILNQYLFGRDMMVIAYAQKAYFPKGTWTDFWTGDVLEGEQWHDISWSEEHGGALYLREGSIIPLGPLMDHTDEIKTEKIDLVIVPTLGTSSFTLYEDDGVSLEHKNEAFLKTLISVTQTADKITVVIDEAKGDQTLITKNRHWTVKLQTKTQISSYSVVGGDQNITFQEQMPIAVNTASATVEFAF